MTSQRKNNLCPGICHSYPTLLSQRITIYRMDAAAAAKSFQSCPTLCDPIDGSPPSSSAPGILQARTLEWVAISFSDACMHAKLLQSCPTLCDPMDSSPPGFSVHGILQARVMEWVAIAFSDQVSLDLIVKSNPWHMTEIDLTSSFVIQTNYYLRH